MSQIHLLLATVALSLSALSAQAQQLKFGHFDSGAFLQSMPEALNIQKTLNDEQSKMENQLVSLQEDFNKQVQSYQQKAQSMTKEQAQAKESELQEMQQRIIAFRTSAIQDLQKKQQELIAPLLQKVKDAVQQVGVNNGFTYIFEREQGAGLVVFAGSKSVDVTPLVKKQLGVN